MPGGEPGSASNRTAGYRPTSGEDLAAWRQGRVVDPLVTDYQRRLLAAGHLAFVFPVWWEAMPAATKGFLDRVLTKGVIYEELPDARGNPFRNRMTNLGGVSVLSVMTTPDKAYRWWYRDPLTNISALIAGGGANFDPWPPVTYIDATARSAAGPVAVEDVVTRPIPVEVQHRIGEALAAHTEVRFVEDPRSVIQPDSRVRDHGALITLAPIPPTGRPVNFPVPVNHSCGSSVSRYGGNSYRERAWSFVSCLAHFC